MNKILLIAGVVIVAFSKAVIVKSILVDQPLYEKCLSGEPFNSGASIPVLACGSDPFTYFILGWITTAVGAAVLILGIRHNTAPARISR